MDALRERDVAMVEELAVTLPPDTWSRLRDAAGRLPLRRSIAPRALEIAWAKLDAALRSCPPGSGRIMTLRLTRAEHAVLEDAAAQGALPRTRPAEVSAIGAYRATLGS